MELITTVQFLIISFHRAQFSIRNVIHVHPFLPFSHRTRNPLFIG